MGLDSRAGSPEGLHPWNVTPREAMALQLKLAPMVDWKDGFKSIRLIAGLDLAFHRSAAGETWGAAAVVVLRYPEMEFVEQCTAHGVVEFPYVPGLLSFREAPLALDAIARLGERPDILMADGHGTAHPRGFGLACHLGVLTKIPTLGCAKSLLCGEVGSLEPGVGSTAALLVGETTAGIGVRTRAGVQPVYVSVGHRISLESAVRVGSWRAAEGFGCLSPYGGPTSWRDRPKTKFAVHPRDPELTDAKIDKL